jgi:multimeric flavodoxin WrbA
MKKLSIIYHSQSGSTARLAQAVVEGASVEANIEIHLRRAMEATTADLLWCDAVMFGTPENLGFMSGGLKDFFDRTFYPAQPHQLNLPYALFISCGNDGTGAVRQIDRIAKGYPLRPVIEPTIIKGEPTEQDLKRCRELGEAFATGLTMGIF